MDLLYGRNSVREALRAGRPIRRVIIADSAHGLDDHIQAARARKIPVEFVDRKSLDRHAGDHHQGIVAEADGFHYVHVDDILASAEQQQQPPLLLALDSLQDPQNFGTLLRTAQAAGIHGVILPEHRAVSVTPGVSNASAGAVEHLRIARVTNLARTLKELKERAIWVYGLSIGANQPYFDADLSGPLTVVVGSEGAGLGRLVAQACDALLDIPMAPAAIQSLNASVAGSLVLYEAFKQRQRPAA